MRAMVAANALGVLVLLLASCEIYDNTCEPGRQLECYCSGGIEGIQVCLEDGSGWGKCQCECDRQCTGKCCGDDGCGGTCEDNCHAGYVCSGLSCECELEKECEVNADCPANHWCDRTTWECREITCTPDCTGKCCGSDGCDGTCPDNCPPEYVCNPSTCWCELDQGCCPASPAGRYFIDVGGSVVDVAYGLGAMLALAPISPMDALTNPNPTHLDELVSAADGYFQSDCFDVTNVALGMVILADDAGFDGIYGDYFPAGTAVKGWNTNSEKWCVEAAEVFAVPTVMVTALDQLPDMHSDTEGFVMGIVVDRNGDPVEGAVVRNGDGTNLARVYYPNADFTELTAGTATSPNGIYVLPGVNFPTGLISITAEKAGMIFGENHAAPKAGFCYFVVIREEGGR